MSEERWITINGNHVLLGSDGKIRKSNRYLQERLKQRLGKGNIIDDKSIIKGAFVERIDKSQIEHKLKEYENEIRGKEIEYAYVIQEDGSVYKFKGDNSTVIVNAPKGSIVTHNHTADGDIYRSFGSDDFYFIKNNNVKELRLTNPDYDYSLKKIKEFDNISYSEIYSQSLNGYDGTDDYEIQHVAMEILKERGYVEYERRNR